jgi:hypothetical protein
MYRVYTKFNMYTRKILHKKLFLAKKLLPVCIKLCINTSLSKTEVEKRHDKYVYGCKKWFYKKPYLTTNTVAVHLHMDRKETTLLNKFGRRKCRFI